MVRGQPSSLLDPALLERIQHLSLVARRVAEGALHGLHRSPTRGLSIEFAQHREYSPGDEPKHLDWQVFAKSDRYVVKQYEQETNLRAVVIVDASASMAYGPDVAALPHDGVLEDAVRPPNVFKGSDPFLHSKFGYARVMAAALAHLMLQQGDSVSLAVTSDRIVEKRPPRASPGYILSICHALERVVPSGKTDLAGVVSPLAAWLKRRGLVVLISDLLDDPQRVLRALGELHHRGHEVVIFQVLDPRELDFRLALAGYSATVIRDMETGEQFEAEPNLIRDLVRAEIQRFLAQLDAGVRGYGIDLVRCSTAQPVEQALTRYLHQRLKGGRRRA